MCKLGDFEQVKVDVVKVVDVSYYVLYLVQVLMELLVVIVVVIDDSVEVWVCV